MKTNEPCSMKWGLNAYAKRIHSHQPAHFVQVDMGQNFGQNIFAILKFCASQRTILHQTVVGCLTNWISWVHN